MLASDLLIEDFPIMAPEDSLSKAIETFLDHCICHVPVVSDSKLEGLLPIDLLMEVSDRTKLISEFKTDYINVFAFADQHGLEVFELMAKYELSALPVVDENHQYVGCITTARMMSTLSNYYSFKNFGGIVELSVGIRDYDLSEISRIVESNNAKILILYMDMDIEKDLFNITIKLDTLDLSRILATFERFKYKVTYSHPSTQQKDELRERYDLLMKLFDI